VRLLDLFCGSGGWSDGFASEGWTCTGVDIQDLGYRHHFIKSDVRNLTPDFIDSFDAVVSSPPCEEFARACLPWIANDNHPTAEALELLNWSIRLTNQKNRITECSLFSRRFVVGGIVRGSWSFWGDVPLLLPTPRRLKTKMSGKHPELRSRIPDELSRWIARQYARGS